jgi:DNA-binding transcriptional LysR family regulator
MSIELRDLRYFVAVAEHGHVTRAAEQLGIEQPPLSMRIKALEQKLEVQLFLRRPRGMELTEAGKTLFAEAKAVLTRLERSVEATRSAARGEQGNLRIAISPTAPFHPFVPQCIRAYRASFPAVGLTIEEGLSDEVQRQLLEQQIDVGFVRIKHVRHEQLSIVNILEEPLVAALPRAHGLARGRRRTIASMKALKDDSFVLYGPPGTGLYDQTIGACAAAGFNPSIGQLAPRIGSTLGFVAAGMGVALVPASMSRVAVDGVVYREFGPSMKATAPLALACRRRDQSPVVRSFVMHVRKLALA